MVLFKLFHGLLVITTSSFINFSSSTVLLDKSPSGKNIRYSSEMYYLGEIFSNFVYNKVKENSHKIKNIDILIPLFRNKSDKELIILEKTISKLSNLTHVAASESYDCKANDIRSYKHFLRTDLYSPTQLYIVPILFDGKVECLQIQLQKMEAETRFNPRAIMVLMKLTNICENSDSDGADSVRVYSIMDCLWSHNLFSSTLVLLSTCDSTITVVTANPFTADNPGRKVKKRGLKYFRSNVNLREFNFNILYQDEVIKDFNGSIFTFGTATSPPFVISSPQGYPLDRKTNSKFTSGTDVEFIKLLSDQNNFKIKMFSNAYNGYESWFKILPNGTKVGILKEMLNFKVDASFGGIWPSFITYYKFDYSSFYTFSSFSWYVSDPEKVPGSMLAFLVFPTGVWNLSLIFYFLSCVTYITLERIGSVNHNTFSIIDRLANFLLINLGFSSTLKPKVAHLRILIFSWIIYSLNWSTVYTTMLYALQSDPPKQKGINTFEDLHKSGLKISMNEVLIEIFSSVKLRDEYRQVLEDNFVCNDFETCLQNLVLYRNYSILQSEAREYEMQLKKWRIHRIRGNMMKFPVGMITNKGNPLHKRLSEMLQRSYQFGLIAKWERYAHLQHREEHGPNHSADNVKRTHILRMSDMIGAFYVLAYGLSAAFVTFIAEIIFKRIIADAVPRKKVNGTRRNGSPK